MSELLDLIDEALDLVPRTSDDDPIAPALADWHRRMTAARINMRASIEAGCSFCEHDPAACGDAGVCQLR